MANSVTARFNDNCKVFVSMSDDTTVEKAVIIDAEGNETDIGGGGGESDFSTANVTFNSRPATNYEVVVPILDDPSGMLGSIELTVGEEPHLLKIPIYKDGATVLYTKTTLNVVGAIESGGDMHIFGQNVKVYLITGDCTIS